jgi:isopenicillin N synthase-like dioxygenase
LRVKGEAAVTATLVEIPVIDFAPFLQGDDRDRKAVAEQIYQACHKIGFMYLKNPGISPELIEQIFEQSQRFFNLPWEHKNNIAWSNELSNRGYVGLGREHLDPDKPGDLKEAFNVGKEVAREEVSEKERAELILNQWPEGEDAFRETVLAFFDECAKAAEIIAEAFAIALGMPESFFADKHNQENYTLRLLHYPPLDRAPEADQVRAGEHSDYGSFTLLFQDNVGGLEVRNARGEWISAPCIPGTVVVNTGDLMERWTNHEFRSTKHRVKVPTDSRMKRSRYSIAFFCHPNNDAQITCLETCQSEERPPLYPPISAGDYLLERLQATY